MVRWLGYFLLALALALTVIGQIAIRFTYPDKSETRLFIDYWWYWGICIAVYFACMAVLRYVERRSA